jgi:hypothetical protein
MTSDRTYFKSKGPSAFIKRTHEELVEVVNNNWKLGGCSCLKAKHLPTIETINHRFGKGLDAQIWLERPSNGKVRCKFEIANKISSLDNVQNKYLREKIADSIRALLLDKKPEYIEQASGSTVVARRIELSRIIADKDDVDFNIDNEVNEIIEFYMYLEAKLNEWNNKDLITAIEICETIDS